MELVTGFLFIQPLFDLAYNMLVIFYNVAGDNLGWAIIIFTLVVKFITLPFTIRQQKTAEKNRDFQTKYKAVQAKYKGKKDQKSRDLLARELATLQAEFLPGQLGGCLPLILQLLFFFQVYFVIINIIQVGAESFNQVRYSFVPAFAEGEVINLNFLGLDLSQSAGSIGLNNIEQVWPYILLTFIVGFSQYVSSRVLAGLPIMPGRGGKDGKDSKKNKDKNGKEVKEDLSFSDALQQSSQQMMYFLPIMTMVISINFFAGLSLYWSVNSGFAIIQQAIVNRKKIIAKLIGKPLEEEDSAKNKSDKKNQSDSLQKKKGNVIEGEIVENDKIKGKAKKGKSKNKNKNKKAKK